MSDAAKPVEFTIKFKNVKFSAVPEDKRVNPEALSPEIRPAYDRIAAAGGAEFVSMTKNGDLRLSGTFTQERKDGTAKAGQVFVAYTSLTKNGNVLDFAGDMVAKFSSPEAVGFARVRVVPGREDGKGGRFQDLCVSFPQTEAERASWLASRGAAEGQDPRRFPEDALVRLRAACSPRLPEAERREAFRRWIEDIVDLERASWLASRGAAEGQKAPAAAAPKGRAAGDDEIPF